MVSISDNARERRKGKKGCSHAAIEMGDKVSDCSREYCPGARKWFLESSVAMCMALFVFIVLVIIITILDSQGVLRVTLKVRAALDVVCLFVTTFATY